MKSVERISVAAARASVIGAPPVGTTVAFEGTLPTAPPAVLPHVNSAIGHDADAAIGQADAIKYLLGVIGHRIEEISPAAASVITLLTGKSGAQPAEALAIAFSNLGAFVPGPDGNASAEASLGVLRDGLRTYVNERLDAELLPVIVSATADAPEVRVYFDEVLLPTFRTVVDTVFATIQAWQSGSGDTQRALRELCSSLLMRLFGRSLVVTGDVLLTHALTNIQSELRQLAASANNAGGIVPTLAGITGLDRNLVDDLVTETLEICAETFGPMPADRRARMRDLMYQMIDTMPPDANASTLESLKAAGMVGNAEAAFELAQLVGEEIAGNLIRFIQALLTRVAAALLALLVDVIADIQQAVEVWMQQIEDLAKELMGQLADLLREINALQARLDDAIDDLLGYASTLLGGFANNSGSRSSIRNKIKDAVKDRALDAIADFPGYGALPGEVRSGIRQTVRNVVNGALDDEIFDPVVDALRALSAGTADLLDDLRAIEPGDDLAAAIADIALDRIEDALRDAFDGDPSVRIKFDVPILGEINLGRIRVPIGTFVSVARSAVRQLDLFDDAVAGATQSLLKFLDIEEEIEAAEDEQTAVSATKSEADERIAETRDGSLDLLIDNPQPASAITGQVTVRLRIPGGVPALLTNGGLSHRRLFMWVNEQEISLDAARTRVEVPLGAGTLSASAGTQPAKDARGSVTARFAHPSASARAVRHDTQLQAGLNLNKAARAMARNTERTPSPRRINAGVASGFAGVSLPRLPVHDAFPPRILPAIGPFQGADENRPVLVVEVDVPAAMLHEGINALACTLVPGSATRRVERAVSFLHVAAAPTSSRRRKMPTTRVMTSLPQALATVLDARGVTQPPIPRAKEAVRQVRGNTWVAPFEERKKTLASSHASLKTELATAAERRGEVRAAISKKALRPRKLARKSKKALRPRKLAPKEESL
jgi:hypothetical protein